ncbi:flagellar motor switch protein FliG [Sulfitobacter sp. S190]|nr:flagellar motor switch protein FliG [Sulfitobacter sp. S190]
MQQIGQLLPANEAGLPHPVPDDDLTLDLGPPPNISRKAKAAIVVRLLLNEGADIPLEDLPSELQADLTQQMGAMRLVDRRTLAHVITEFANELDQIGLSFPGGIAGALDALEGRISRETAARLRKEAGVRAAGDPWKRLAGQDAETLAPMLEAESTEVAAVVLSKLDVSLAAGILAKLPGPAARRITYAVQLTNKVTPEAVEQIGLSLVSQLDARPVPAFETEAAQRLGAILNNANSPTRDGVMEGLEETDGTFATAVRRAIFTFGNIPERIETRDIPRVLREVDPAVLLTAMAGAEAAGFADARDHILDNMSSRMADQLREDIAEGGKVKPADCEEAMSTIINVIREMERNGDLTMIELEQEEDG